MEKLLKQLNSLDDKIAQHECINLEVSKVSVGWQIEHTLLTIEEIIKAMANSNPANYKWKFSFAKIIILILKKLPRGKAKVPKIVTPKEYTEASLKSHLQEVKGLLKKLETIDKDQYFYHPYFGDLKRKEAIKFIEIHTKHHLDIIDDILK